MEILRGIAVAPGVAIGEAVVLEAEDFRIPYRTVTSERIATEIELLHAAIRDSLKELAVQAEWLHSQLGPDAANVFEWHKGVLKDAKIREAIENQIREKSSSAAYAVSTVMRHYQRRFLQMSDPLLIERTRDVQDIERRLLKNILGETREDLAHLTKPAILVAHDLTPTQTAQLADTKVIGVALDVGAGTSHTAILLRSWGKPGVIGLNDIVTRVSGGDTLIIDGTNQLVIANPNESTLAEYRAREAAYGKFVGELEEIRSLESVTADGEPVPLWSNIEFPREAAIGKRNGAVGVGLYRTEFLFLRPEGAPSEDEQYEAYRAAIAGADGTPVTIRTFDLGADKYTQQKSYEQERNPMLGLRSIRYSLQHLDMFKIQLRAILRASVHGQVRLMFPLIVSLMELRQAKMTLHDAMEDLEEAGVRFQRNFPIGMMLETPAAAVQIREFCREVDFVSIGTNDLIQYLLAVDRGNERVARFFSASHPAVLRTVHEILKACTQAGVHCSLCGEMAGQPMYAACLLGLGLRNFSMAPANLPEMKKIVRRVRISHAKRVAKRALSFETDWQVNNYLRDETKRLLPQDPF